MLDMVDNILNVKELTIRKNPREDSLETSNVPVSMLVRAFIGSLDCKNETKKEYEKVVKLYCKWVENTGRNFSDLTRQDILAFKESLLSASRMRSSQTVSLYMCALRRFYAWAEAERYYPNIAKDVRSPRVKKEFVKQHLTPEECSMIMDSLCSDIEGRIRKISFGNSVEVGLRNYAMINLLIRAGLRTIEVSRLDVGDVTLRKGHRILRVWGKGRDGKDDFVPLSEKAYGPIEEYLSTRSDALSSDPLFACEGYGNRGRRMSARRIQEICKETLREIGIDDHAYSAHSFRHTCAVLMIQAGVNQYDVQKYLRHKSINTTEIYLKSIEEDLRLTRAPEKALDEAF